MLPLQFFQLFCYFLCYDMRKLPLLTLQSKFFKMYHSQDFIISEYIRQVCIDQFTLSRFYKFFAKYVTFVLCDQAFFRLLVFWEYSNLQIFAHNNKLYKVQVFHFFQLYIKRYYKLVILSLPITIYREHLRVRKKWSFSGIFVLSSNVFCIFQWVLSSALCNSFAIAKKIVSILLAWVKWDWSILFCLKKVYFVWVLWKKQFLSNRLWIVFQNLILLFFGCSVRLLLLVQFFIPCAFNFLFVIYNERKLTLLFKIPWKEKDTTKTIKQEHPQRKKKFEFDTQNKYIFQFYFLCSQEIFGRAQK